MDVVGDAGPEVASPPVVRLFGGVAVSGPDGDVDLGGPKQRAVLAALACEPGLVVPIDRLLQVIWGDAPPRRAEVSIRGYVSNLRKALALAGAEADKVIQFRERGYVLNLAPDAIDVHRFEAAVRDGSAHLRLGEMVEAHRTLVAALALWRGPVFGATGDDVALLDVVTRLDQRRAEAVEGLIDARLALGEHADLSADLLAEIAREPYRERLRIQLATALYRAGRHVEALRSLDDARRVLADDIGVEPGPEMRALEASILSHDPSLGAPPPERDAPHAPSMRTDATLFGRSAERDLLTSALGRLADGGMSVIVSGEAGIGKTALMRELRVEAGALGLRVGWGRCPESATAAPYRSWSAAFRQIVEAGGSRQVIDALAAPAGAPAVEDQAAGRLATHMAVVDALRTLPAPVVVVIDDLQWADDATLALVEFLAGELEDLPLLLAMTVRRTTGQELPGTVRDCLAELTRSPRTLQLRLEGLDERSIAAWIESSFGDRPADDLTTLLAETTDGNPFYLGELIALLHSEGRTTRGQLAQLPATIPAAVQDVVRRRTSRLPPETQALLAIGAVIGRRFDVDVLASVADVDRLAVLDALGAALDAALVEADESVPGRFVFVHALVSEALMAEQNPLNLAKLHARITTAIEDCRAGQLDSWLDELAHHAWAGASAGTAEQAIRYAVAAADVAQAAQASGDVAAHLGRALAVMAVSGGRPIAQRIELLVRLGVAQRDAGDLPGGRSSLVEACLLAESVGDDAAVATAMAALNADDLWAGIDWSTFDQRVVTMIERILQRTRPESHAVTALLSAALAAELLYLDPARSDRVSSDAVVAAEDSGDPIVVARVLLQRYWAVSGSEGNAERARIGDRLIQLTESDLLPARFVPLAHLARVSAAYEVGDMELVHTCLERARASAHPVRTPTGWAHLQYLETSLALLAGDLVRAAACADAVGEAFWRVRRFAAAATRSSLLAVIHAEAGRFDDALTAFSVMESTAYSASSAWLKAWILAEAGRDHEGAAALASFDAPLGDDWYRTPLTVAAVLAAAQIGDTAFLRRHLGELAPVAGRFVCLGSGGIVLGPVAHALARGHHALGDIDAARSHAAQALDLSTHMGAVLWARRSEALLGQLG